MEQSNHSAKLARQRRFLMVLPLLTLPFITLMFWAFGGGKGGEAKANTKQAGINLKLPDAKLKDDKTLDKLSFYHQAALDSAKTKAAEKLDPYWSKFSADSNYSMNSLKDYEKDANKTKVYNKLDELKKILNNAEQTSRYSKQSNADEHVPMSYSSTRDIDRLQSTMQQMQSDQTEDPEITQLNNMLDKIQAIQNPEQNKAAEKEAMQKGLAVKAREQKASISLLTTSAGKQYNADTAITAGTTNGFYSSSPFADENDSAYSNSIDAVIPETQTLVSGSTVKLTLSNDVVIQGINLPSGTTVFGTASLSNERLKIVIKSIRFQNTILPVSLDVYDMDGQEGIYIPGSITRTVAKESSNNAISGIGSAAIDPSIGAQLASAGIETAKTLFSKKVKLIKVTVKTGYKVLLKDSHNN